MPITFQAQASGQKTATTGTTATIALNSTAGDQIVVAIAQSSNTITVSSVTDGGGNTYHQVARATNSTTIGVDIWVSDKVGGTAASGTLTVTVSASGARISACAASYRGVAFARPASTNTNTTSPITSGSKTLSETNSWIVMAGGTAANNAFTQQNGQLRVQATGTTSLRGLLMDSNDAASPVTVSATMTAATWAVAMVELQLLEVTQLETMTMSDAESNIFGFNPPIIDVMELKDADSTNQLVGFEDVDYKKFPHWQEDFRIAQTNSVTGVTALRQLIFDANDHIEVSAINAGIGTPTISTQNPLTWVDGSPVMNQGWEILIFSPDTTWADVAPPTMRLQFQMDISQSLSFWQDLLRAGYGAATSDQIVFVDSLNAGYGASLTDSINFWADVGPTMQLQFQLDIAQSMMFWQDLYQTGAVVVPLTLTLSDSDTTWLDALGVGYGNIVSDSITFSDSLGAGYGGATSDTMTMSDFTGAGYGGATSDQIIFVDSLGAGYGAGLSDSMNNWLDSLATLFSIALTLTDNLNNWADALGLGYGSAVNDLLTMSDFTAAGYGSATSDQLIISDSLGAGYGAVLSDNLNNWLDALVTLFSIALTLTDSLNNWLDALAIGYGNATSDQLVMSDFTAAGYGSATSDQLIITDSLGAGYGAALSDSMNNWLDSLATLFSIALTLTDTDSTWADTLAIGYGNVISNTMTMSDFTGAGYGSATSDQLVIVDSLSSGYGAVLSDNLNNWQDLLSTVLGLNFTFSDSLNNWLDFMAAGYGASMSDQIIVVDTLGAGYGAALSDNMNNWQDLFQFTFPSLGLTLTDNMNNWADALGLGYGNATNDQLVMSDFTGAGYGSATSDQIIFVDSLGAGYGASLSDSGAANWADLLKTLFGFGINLSDSDSTWLDALRAGYGSATSDQLVIVDSLGAGYGALTSDAMVFGDTLAVGYGMTVSDTLNFWLDQLTFVIGFGFSFADSMNNWTDALGVGYGLVFVDSGALLDGMAIGHGYAISDTNTLVDTLGMGYGFLISDTMNFWLDSAIVVAQSFTPIDVVLTDTITTWFDAVSASLQIQFGRAVISGVMVAQHVSLISQVGPLVTCAPAQVIQSQRQNISPSFNLVLTDGMIWSDTMTTFGQYFLVTGDAIAWRDSMQANGPVLSLGIEDAMGTFGDGPFVPSSFSDGIVVGGGIRLIDSINFWNDAVPLIPTQMLLFLSDTGQDNWDDHVPSFTYDYTIGIGENASGNWQDAVIHS